MICFIAYDKQQTEERLSMAKTTVKRSNFFRFKPQKAFISLNFTKLM